MSESELEPVQVQAGPGRTLASARAEMNLSVADVSQQIKFGIKQIEAIEADDYAKLPGTTFVRGMIRSYAKLLQLDPKPLLAELDKSDLPTAVTVELAGGEHEPFLEGGKKSNRVYGLLSLAALVAVAAVAYEWQTSPPPAGEVVLLPKPVAKPETPAAPQASASEPEQPPSPTAPALAAGPAPLAPAAEQATAAVTPAAKTPAASGAGVKHIGLVFDDISWVEVKQANGKVLLSQLNAAGTRQQIEGVPPFDVVIGNAAHVRMTYNDQAFDLRPYVKVDVARLTLD